MTLTDDETREAYKRVDLLTIEAGAITSGDKELLNHVHYYYGMDTKTYRGGLKCLSLS